MANQFFLPKYKIVKIIREQLSSTYIIDRCYTSSLSWVMLTHSTKILGTSLIFCSRYLKRFVIHYPQIYKSVYNEIVDTTVV